MQRWHTIGAGASQFLQDQTCFFPPRCLSLEFSQAKTLSQGRQGLSARLASNVNTTFQSCFTPLPFVFMPWWDGEDVSGMFSFGQTTQVEDIYPCPPNATFFLEHCSLLLQAKQGRIVMGERNSPLLCCVLSFASCGQSCIVLILIHICQE